MVCPDYRECEGKVCPEHRGKYVPCIARGRVIHVQIIGVDKESLRFEYRYDSGAQRRGDPGSMSGRSVGTPDQVPWPAEAKYVRFIGKCVGQDDRTRTLQAPKYVRLIGRE